MKYTNYCQKKATRPIRASMPFEFDYRHKISSLLPHETHKEISAHLNIAWKSIGQDILQLYKDLAKKIECKLKHLNGELDERIVRKRKAAAALHTSREPPPNSGLRRCRCREDCPKYKIIPGSDLDKKWQAKYGSQRPNSVSREDFTSDSGNDLGGATPAPATRSHRRARAPQHA